MPKPERGRIVWVELLDPQGRNPKRRPAVIITASDEIKRGETFVVVGISTELGQSLPQNHVELPWDRKKHPKTGLKERCAAVCNWLVEIREADIQEYAGVVPGKKLLEILEKVGSLI